MGGEESVKPVNVDPRCIQAALRMYFQPIKSDDPQVDFYTMYKQETTEHDTDYMQKYNEDLNTTLIFAGLFSAVSSAFVIAVQSKLEPDTSARSEAYLRAILISLDRSVAPGEALATPPPWSGPPAEIVTTSDLLYASLLMSLLAAFVAMLGKQWLNQYLRHTGGSMVERCGDRQRKFDGLEKWPFRLFIESLPIMLQIALLLLACGLSRYMWSINTSVARVVISFTTLGVIFYIGIVVAGTSSYECPFQTPASIGLRNFKDSGTTQRILASLSPPQIISFVSATRKNTRTVLVSAYQHIYDITRSPLSWEFSLSQTMSALHCTATTVGHRTIILLLHADQAFRNAKQRLTQEVRKLIRGDLLPTTAEDAHRLLSLSRNGPGLLVRVRNLEILRKQNTDNVRCVSWVLRNITDPEAIDSAVRLAGTIRWFDGDPNHDPPFDLIVSSFEACFDSTKQLYPGMRDRAYFSARAILQISLRARIQSQEHASRYPITIVPLNTFQHTDPDLHHVIRMLECNFCADRPTLDFPMVGTNTHGHLLWMSNLFVDLTREGPNPIMKSYESYLSAAVTNHRGMIANILLMWYLFLGGRVEEETFWAVDKSDSLETILSHLSTRVMNAIGDGDGLLHLNFLLEFLAAWEKRPACLTPMVYEWASAICEAARRLGLGLVLRLGLRLALRIGFGLGFVPSGRPQLRLQPGLRLRLQPQDLAFDEVVSSAAEQEFPNIGPSCDPVRLAHTPNAQGYPRETTHYYHGILLSITLEIGFRLIKPGSDSPPHHLKHTSHHDLVFVAAFASRDDGVIADAVCTWVAGTSPPPGSCVRYFVKRVDRDVPFSPRLRRVSIHVIELIWRAEFEMSPLETIRLLNRLEVTLDDMQKKREWAKMLVDVIRSPIGLEKLSPHYWHLLASLVSSGARGATLVLRDAEVVRALEEAEDWERLEVWLVLVWNWLGYGLMGDDTESEQSTESGGDTDLEEDADYDDTESMDAEDFEEVTLNFLLQRPSAIPRFEELSDSGELWTDQDVVLRRICHQARAEHSPSHPPPPPRSIRTQTPVPLTFLGDDTF